jgi:hypothetical protein
MSRDRFVRWNQGKYPTVDKIKIVCEDYFKGLGTVEWRGDRFFVLVHGTLTYALNRIGAYKQPDPEPGFDERWIEVWQKEDNLCLDVITRQQDEVTNALADGLAKLFARFWRGCLED